MMPIEVLEAFALLVTALVAVHILKRIDGRRLTWAPEADSQVAELWVFFRQWLSRPLSTAAFSPSSRFLNRRMVHAIPPGTRRVIELGAGTGALTHALIEHGIAVDDLLAIEVNPSLHRYLSRRFPGLAVVQGDARTMGQMAEVAAFAGEAPVQAVVSGLGLLSMSREAQRAILSSAFELLPEDGAFVQFTYGPVAPVADEVMRGLGLRASRHGFTLRNVPPAWVYVFTRDGAPRGCRRAQSKVEPVVLAKLLFGGGRGGTADGDRALAILRERYARGEIDKQELDARRRDLGG